MDHPPASGRSGTTVPARAGGDDVLTVHLDPIEGLAHLERVVGLLRGRRHGVSSVSASLEAGVATVVVRGPGLLDGADDPLVVRRLERLLGVTAVTLGPGAGLQDRPDPREDARPELPVDEPVVERERERGEVAERDLAAVLASCEVI